MILLLVAAALLLHFPPLRRAVGAYLAGVLFLVAMTLTFGAAGVLVAVGLGAVAFVKGFYRPASKR